MCGRFAQIDAPMEMVEAMGGVVHEPVHLHYNISPGQWAMGYRLGPQGPELLSMRWGLLPPWSSDASHARRQSQARMESVAEKPSFRQAFRRRRCVLPVDGYFEWQGPAQRRQPWYMQGREGLMMLAGLWERWEDPQGDAVETFAVITTEATGEAAQIHHRMPLTIPPQGLKAWLDPSFAAPEKLLQSYARATPQQQLHPVTRRVNHPDFDDPICLQPLSAESLRREQGAEQMSLF
uniref:Abasic site processing protein n=1 Tax=Magnetococcus massalia (strain MO-1) TaxID=451514 RepID=A0A1S7LBZ0_MAGMO|nr:Conserved protein of unknown function [Candidatus Magnetococcus massalia]